MKLPLTLLAFTTATAFSQGPLAPDAAPDPLMKTLDQIEPRIPVNATNTPGDTDSLFKITQPGSYYLTGNITGVADKHGIEIEASGVTLDLNGFELKGPGGANFSGVLVTTIQTSIVVVNGSVRNWGAVGVALVDGSSNHRVDGVRASGNSSGILVGSGSKVMNCTVSGNSSDGISTSTGSTVTNCTASSNGGGIYTGNRCAVTNCTASGNSAEGIFTGPGSTVTSCTAFGNGFNGINTNAGSTVTNCTAYENTYDGIETGSGCTVTNCTAINNTVNGIDTISGCTVTNCTASANTGSGIDIFSGGTVSNCTARQNNLDGISCGTSCVIRDNTCANNGFPAGNGAGVRVTGGDNRIEGNNCTAADLGIVLLGAGNIMIRNTCSGNTINYDIFTGNRYGPIVNITAANPATVSGNSAASTLGSTDPWANFAY